MYTDILFLIGRIIFGGFFLMNAYNHLIKTEGLAGYAQSKNVSNPKMAIFFTGLLLLVGGLGILLGAYIQLAVIALIIFLLGVSFKMHAFWAISDPIAKMSDMVNFTKNMALLGAVLMILAIPTPWPYSV